MNTTPEERAELRRWHREHSYHDCDEPCGMLRLLDDADEADALRARAEAAEADNAALREGANHNGLCDLNDLTSDKPCSCILAQPHPGDALRERLRVFEDAAQFLFRLLDDIDTASDWAKGNDKAYRKYVEKRQSHRSRVADSDGYTVTFKAATDAAREAGQ